MAHDSTQKVSTPDGAMDLYEVVPDAKASGAVIVTRRRSV